jgi:cyclase
MLLAGSGLIQAQDAPTSFKSTEVVPGIYMLEGDGGFAGGNITLVVGDERVVLIDDGLEPMAPLLIDAAGEIAGRSIDFVINTHVHLDHLGGNATLTDTGATILAHNNVHSRMLAEIEEYGGPDMLPLVTFSDSVTFHLNGQEAFVFHVEHAHTDGDAVIHFRDVNVIHAGDIMFNSLFPFVDLDNGGSYAGYMAGQRKILALADDDTIIIPGHGPLARKADLQVAIDMLEGAEALIKKLVDAGKSEDEILEANPLSVYHDEWNWGFITTERMTRSLVRSLTEGATH